jgi:hypothetical protein
VCALKKSLYEDVKFSILNNGKETKITEDPMRKPILESNLLKHLALEAYCLHDDTNFGKKALEDYDE